MGKTLGEIAKSHGFDSLSDYVNATNKLIDEIKANSFNVGDSIKLKAFFTSTHFNEEDILPFNTEFVITEKSTFTLGEYYVKLEGYEPWFSATVFERI